MAAGEMCRMRWTVVDQLMLGKAAVRGYGYCAPFGLEHVCRMRRCGRQVAGVDAQLCTCGRADGARLMALIWVKTRMPSLRGRSDMGQIYSKLAWRFLLSSAACVPDFEISR
jgi:hypothetical protein